MSQQDEDFGSSNTPGYKIGAKKTVDEYANLDAEDESLARWKASLGIVAGGAAGSGDPKLTILTLELHSETLPPGKALKMNVQDKSALANIKKHPFVIKEGILYHVRITFKVENALFTGIKYQQVVKRAGVTVDKMEQMLGSYPPHPEEVRIKDFEPEESPSGLLARSGSYNVRSRVVDDDNHIVADWEWTFKLAKEWE